MYSALSGPTDWILRYIKTTFTSFFYCYSRGNRSAVGESSAYHKACHLFMNYECSTIYTFLLFSSIPHLMAFFG